MDFFIEQIVEVRKSFGKILLMILIWFAAVVLSLGLLAVGVLGLLGQLSMFAALACAGLIWLAWKLTTDMHVEYEYMVTNGDFDVDMIIGRRKRKRVLSARCQDFESFGKYEPARHEHRNYDKRIVAGNLSDNTWYGTLRHNDLGHVLVVFEPEERVLKAMRKFLPKLVAQDAFRGL